MSFRLVPLANCLGISDRRNLKLPIQRKLVRNVEVMTGVSMLVEELERFKTLALGLRALDSISSHHSARRSQYVAIELAGLGSGIIRCWQLVCRSLKVY